MSDLDDLLALRPTSAPAGSKPKLDRLLDAYVVPQLVRRAVSQTLVVEQFVCDCCGHTFETPGRILFEYQIADGPKTHEWSTRPSAVVPRKVKRLQSRVACCQLCFSPSESVDPRLESFSAPQLEYSRDGYQYAQSQPRPLAAFDRPTDRRVA